MTTLYRPVEVLTPAMARTVGVLHYQDAKQSMWLVPIEAEEETGREFIDDDGEFYESDARPTLTRLVTPWEEA